MRCGIVLDVDDTLYLERDYVRSGFAAVAAECSAAAGVSAEAVFDFLWDGFEAGTRGNAFDELRLAFSEVANQRSTEDLVAIYRSHRPDITLLPDAAALTAELQAGDFRTGVITDGPQPSQEAKVAALGLVGWVDTMVLTGAWGNDYAKPHERSYLTVAGSLGLDSAHLVYVADNPAKDFVTPNRLGWLTIRIRRPGQLHFTAEAADAEHAAAVELASLDRLLDAIGAASA